MNAKEAKELFLPSAIVKRKKRKREIGRFIRDFILICQEIILLNRSNAPNLSKTTYFALANVIVNMTEESSILYIDVCDIYFNYYFFDF